MHATPSLPPHFFLNTPLSPHSLRPQALSTQELLNNVIPSRSIIMQIESMPSIRLQMRHKCLRGRKSHLSQSGDRFELRVASGGTITTAKDGILHFKRSASSLNKCVRAVNVTYPQ